MRVTRLWLLSRQSTDRKRAIRRDIGEGTETAKRCKWESTKAAMRPALWVVGDPALPPLRRRNSELRPREYLTPAVFGPVCLYVPLSINAGPRAEIALAHLTSRVARAEATGMPARDNKVQPPRTGRPLPPGAVQTTWVTGRKTRSEYMFSALPQIADIARSEFHNSANQPYCRSRVLRVMRSGPEQCHARLGRNNAPRLSTIEWLWSARRA